MHKSNLNFLQIQKQFKQELGMQNNTKSFSLACAADFLQTKFIETTKHLINNNEAIVSTSLNDNKLNNNKNSIQIIYQEIDKYLKTLEKRLSTNRLKHSISVAAFSLELALKFSMNDKELACIMNFSEYRRLLSAALMHDYCKEISNSEQLKLAQIYNIEISETDLSFPNLLHARTAAALLEDQLDFEDQKLLNAISQHTLGAKQMSVIAKILYLADILEPLRDAHLDKPVSSIQKLRDQIFSENLNINQALLEAMNNKLQYIIKKNQLIDIRAVKYRNTLLKDFKSLQNSTEKDEQNHHLRSYLNFNSLKLF